MTFIKKFTMALMLMISGQACASNPDMTDIVIRDLSIQQKAGIGIVLAGIVGYAGLKIYHFFKERRAFNALPQAEQNRRRDATKQALVDRANQAHKERVDVAKATCCKTLDEKIGQLQKSNTEYRKILNEIAETIFKYLEEAIKDRDFERVQVLENYIRILEEDHKLNTDFKVRLYESLRNPIQEFMRAHGRARQ